jgi:hypothetical protein
MADRLEAATARRRKELEQRALGELCPKLRRLLVYFLWQLVNNCTR